MTAATPPPAVPGMTGLSVLARGGYATVYRAMQESVGREVAVKIENRTLENERDRRRFLREARAAGRMSSHPHVVDLFDAGVTPDGHPYLIMELCDGSYSERMKTAPLRAGEARDVGFKIADALADAHSLGVLHRDVKPANILFSRFGEPALADFGLAILAEWRDVSITLDTLTPAYAPPEMFRHSPPEPSADVYALCATLYALMRGKPPRWSDDQAPSLLSLVDMFQQQIPDLPGVPPEMMRLLRAGMANDEASRPTALQLRDELLALRLEPAGPVIIPPLGSPPLHPVYTSSASTAPPLPRPEEDHTVPHGIRPMAGLTPGPSRPRGRRGLWWSIAAGAALVATFVALAVVFGGGGIPGVDPSRTPIAVKSTGPVPSTPTRSAGPQPTGSGSACGLGAPSVARCSDVAECYDAALKPVNCAGQHTWEQFAFADLPADVEASDLPKVKEVPQVRDVCSLATLATVTLGIIGWQTTVLAPSAADLNAGRRTYRCLAGKGNNALTGPQLKK